MCGIISVISKTTAGLSYKDTKIFKELLFANTLRGMDATGVYGVNKYGNLTMAKTAKAAPFALGESEMAKVIVSADRVLVGHNRAATIGNSKDDKNAHPFIEDHICLVHNGTLHSHKELANTTVDSHAICHSLASRGYKETLPMINGAFALIWYDAKLKELFVVRNNQRPLAIAETESAIYLASEGEMLNWILQRNSVDIAVNETLTDLVYRFSVDEYALQEENFPVKKAKPTPQVGGTGVGSIRPTNEKPWDWDHELLVGDTLTFDIDNMEFSETYNEWIVTGYTEEGNLIEALVDDNFMTKFMDYDPIIKVTAKITAIYYYSKTKTIKFQCGYAKEKVSNQPIKSSNGVKVTEQQFIESGGCCTQCNNTLDFDDMPVYHVKMKHKKISTLICEDCLNEFRKTVPNYGKGKKYKKNSDNSIPVGEQISQELKDLYPILCGSASSYC